jgi:hypothetical protein
MRDQLGVIPKETFGQLSPESRKAWSQLSDDVRLVFILKLSKTFSYTGTTVGPKNDLVLQGCYPQEIAEFGLQKGAFSGVILPGIKISAHDGIHKGIWEPAFSAKTKLGYEDMDGIRWNDGNKWFAFLKEYSLWRRGYL